jgi:hypothetical protein
MKRIIASLAALILAIGGQVEAEADELAPPPRQLLVINVWKVSDQYLREDNGKPIVWFQIGDKVILTKWIEVNDPKAPKRPPFREDEIERAWLDCTPGLYKVQYRGEKK